MADDTCSIAGCLRRVESRGWCKAHYSRWLRTGNTGDDPLTAEASDVGKCHIDGCYYCSRECGVRGDECNATELEECVGCKQDNDCKTQAALRECVECATCADNNCQNPNEGI